MNEIDENYLLMRRMILAMNKVDGAYYYLARDLGANDNELTLLYALDDGQPHSQREVCDEWLMPRTTVNSTVKKLEAAGYVTLAPGARTREKTIVLTESGHQYAERLLEPLYATEEAAMRDTLREYSPEFVAALESFSKNFAKHYAARAKKNEEAK